MLEFLNGFFNCGWALVHEFFRSLKGVQNLSSEFKGGSVQFSENPKFLEAHMDGICNLECNLSLFCSDCSL